MLLAVCVGMLCTWECTRVAGLILDKGVAFGGYINGVCISHVLLDFSGAVTSRESALEGSCDHEWTRADWLRAKIRALAFGPRTALTILIFKFLAII